MPTIVELLPTLVDWEREHRERQTIVLITSGAMEEKLASRQSHALENVLAQDDREVANAYGVNVTPSAGLVSADGRIESSRPPGDGRG